jgi:predicted Zn finger-like uncharacterized protein
MLIACPHCQTQFQVAAHAIGEGRTVRCARCRESWFAEPPPVFGQATTFAGETETSTIEAEPVAAEAEAMEAPVEVTDSPPIAVEVSAEIDAAQIDSVGAEPVAQAVAEEAAKPRLRRRIPVHRYRLPRPVAIGLVVAVIAVVAALALRESIVRMAPGLAGAYAAIGLPVNLRGLEFRGVKTTQEIQDGVPVLVIEGEVVNVTRHPVEVPRVRIAVLGSSQQELYAWTTLLQRSMLADNEKVAFRSRLASPPPNGKEVLVRFITRGDLTRGM